MNVVGSTIAREADGGIYVHAGPEIGVASTKAFTSQVVALAAVHAQARPTAATCRSCAGGRSSRRCTRFRRRCKQILDRAQEIEDIAEEFKRAQNFLYLGRGYNFPAALEGALKLKEISYIHAEGYPAAEMKHGPIALIDEMMPVVFIAPHDSVFDKVDVERAGGEGAKGPRDRDHESRRAVARRASSTTSSASRRRSTCSRRCSRACRFSCSRTTSR